jgi:hypothetical protein
MDILIMNVLNVVERENQHHILLIMRKDKQITLNNGYLIGDSYSFGKDQCISDTIRLSGKFDDANQNIIEKAKDYANKNGYKNIRLVTCKYIALTIKTGIISWIKVKESVKPFKF